MTAGHVIIPSSEHVPERMCATCHNRLQPMFPRCHSETCRIHNRYNREADGIIGSMKLKLTCPVRFGMSGFSARSAFKASPAAVDVDYDGSPVQAGPIPEQMNQEGC